MQLHAGAGDLVGEVAQGLVELLLARHLLGHVELAADLGRAVVEVHLVAALGQHRRGGQPGRAGADHGDALLLLRGGIDQFGLVACARIHQAGGGLQLEGVIEAGLVAADAGVDLVRAVLRGLVDELGIGQQRTRHADHVGLAGGEDLLRDLRIVDAIGGAERDLDLLLHPLGDPGEGTARHRGRDGRHARLMPADAGVDDRRAGAFDRLGELHDFFPALAVGDQIEHRQPVDDDEVLADGLAHPGDDLHRQPHAILPAAAPFILALVDVRDQELVDEIALGAHHLDAVVAGFTGQLGAAHVGLDLAFHAAAAEGARADRRDR